MVDKRRFYLVRNEFFTSGNGNLPSGVQINPRAMPKQTLDEAKAEAMAAAINGKSFNIFEVKLVGRAGAPEPTWQPVRKPRKVRKAKRSKRNRK